VKSVSGLSSTLMCHISTPHTCQKSTLCVGEYILVKLDNEGWFLHTHKREREEGRKSKVFGWGNFSFDAFWTSWDTLQSSSNDVIWKCCANFFIGPGTNEESFIIEITFYSIFTLPHVQQSLSLELANFFLYVFEKRCWRTLK
jgi:hypothetical protein